jgi:SAM-dependent methyltransferase
MGTQPADPPAAPRARTEIHTKVMAMIRSLGVPPGRALDAPLGPGALARELLSLHWQVAGVDIDLKQSEGMAGTVERKVANLNGSLPFPDGRFDLVTSLEGIEHVENHFHVLREFGRVTKPGGHLIISTPNICNLEDRLNFLLRGAFYRYITREEMERHGSGFDHQNLISYLEMRQVLDWAGFDLLAIEKDRSKWKQDVFLSPVWLLIKLVSGLQSARRRARYRLSETNSAPVLLGGPTLILLARRRSA